MPRVVYEGWLDGEFRGWFGSTIVQTVDGRCWQQIDDERVIRFYHRPAVSIHRRAGLLLMVVGDLEPRPVEQVECPQPDRKTREVL
jgi:hypothetical protein